MRHTDRLLLTTLALVFVSCGGPIEPATTSTATTDGPAPSSTTASLATAQTSITTQSSTSTNTEPETTTTTSVERGTIDSPSSIPGELTIMFVAVRQGDAALYQGPCGEVGLIDANRFRSIEVLTAMDSLGGRDLAWVSPSHYDADHLGAIVDVVTAPGVTVGAAYDRGGDRNAKDTDTYRDYYDWVTTAGIRQPVDIGDTFTLCEGSQQVTFTVLSAGTDGTAIRWPSSPNGLVVTEENDRGLCLKVDYQDFDLVTCGDINGTNDGSRTDLETPVGVVVGDVEVVKVNHHGSDYSSNQTYVAALSAEAAVISVGKNSFGHPAASVVALWETIGDVYITQSSADNALINGTITIVTDGISGFTVTTETSGTAIEYPLDDE